MTNPETTPRYTDIEIEAARQVLSERAGYSLTAYEALYTLLHRHHPEWLKAHSPEWGHRVEVHRLYPASDFPVTIEVAGHAD